MAGLLLNQPTLGPMMERAPKKSRYTLVAAAARRARQLLEGEPPLVALDSTKPVTIALHEIHQAKLVCELSRGGLK